MKTLRLLSAVGVLALGLATNSLGSSLDLNSAEFLGTVVPGTPASEEDEASYVNGLLLTGLGTSRNEAYGQNKTRVYTRTSNACPNCTSVPDPPSYSGGTGSTGIDVTGFDYLYAKYGEDGYVWYVGDLADGDTVSILSTTGQGGGLSHYSLFRGESSDTVPDGGMTLMLLGGALVGLETLRRRSRV